MSSLKLYSRSLGGGAPGGGQRGRYPEGHFRWLSVCQLLSKVGIVVDVHVEDIDMLEVFLGEELAQVYHSKDSTVDDSR